MRTPSRRRTAHGPPPTTLTRLVAELRELPDGLATPVRADLLLTDALTALGYPPSGVAELVGVDADRAGSGVLEVLR